MDVVCRLIGCCPCLCVCRVGQLIIRSDWAGFYCNGCSFSIADLSSSSPVCLDVEMDKTTKKRILEVSKFDETDRLHIFSVIDAFIAKRKIQSIM